MNKKRRSGGLEACLLDTFTEEDAFTIKDVSSRLGVSEGSARQCVNNMVEKGLLFKVSDTARPHRYRRQNRPELQKGLISKLTLKAIGKELQNDYPLMDVETRSAEEISRDADNQKGYRIPYMDDEDAPTCLLEVLYSEYEAILNGGKQSDPFYEYQRIVKLKKVLNAVVKDWQQQKLARFDKQGNLLIAAKLIVSEL